MSVSTKYIQPFLHLSMGLALFLFSCRGPENKLEGLWELQIMEVRQDNGEWKEWRDGMQGFLMYDRHGNMSLHLTTRGYETTSLQFPNFTDSISQEALKHITNNYNYFGQYRINRDSGWVVHQRISHSNPAEWSSSVTRKFHFRKDTLVISPKEEKNARLRLKWLRYTKD